jgi:hypothetical protein
MLMAGRRLLSGGASRPPALLPPLHNTARRRAAACAPCASPPHRRRRAPAPPAAAATEQAAARLSASLIAAEAGDDVMLVADVLAEARVSGVALPPTAVEAGVRALANGGQWARAAALFRELPWAAQREPQAALPQASTVHALFLAAVQAPLGAGEDAERRADGARDVLDALARACGESGAASGAPLDLSPAFNRVVRAYARCPGGTRLDAAMALLSEMVAAAAEAEEDEQGGRIAVDGSTFGSLAAACIDAGRPELAEEVLDCRDYL